MPLFDTLYGRGRRQGSAEEEIPPGDVIPPNPTDTTHPPVTPPVDPAPKPGGGAGYGTFSLPAYPGPMSPDIPAFTPPSFHAPSAADAFSEPGYQFRLKSGEDALQASAAAKGVLRTGGTLKDIVNYGQNFASQEYGNVFDRALRGFGTDYQGAKDQYAPQLAKAMAGFQRPWDVYQSAIQAALAKEGFIYQTLNPGPPPSTPTY